MSLTTEETEPISLSRSPQPPRMERGGDQVTVLADGAFFSLMVGLGETYLPAFVLALGASQLLSGVEITTGLLASVPAFLGAVVQLLTPAAVQQMASHRRWVVATVVVQAASLLLMPVALLLDAWSLPVLFAIASVYWAAGLSCGPPWNTWMEDVITPAIRANFFARRVRICQFFTMLGFVGGGLLLESGKQSDWLMPAFVSLFLIAGFSRLISAGLLASTSEPETARSVIRGHNGFGALRRRLSRHSGMQVLWFLFAMQASVQISGPYFTPFMLRKLNLGYDEFMLLVALGFAGKVVALPACGRIADRCGAHRLLWIGGASIVPVSGVWIGLQWIAEPIPYLCVVQFLGGLGWAAYELGLFLMFFEAIPRRDRTTLLTLYNFGNNAALLVGALVGAAFLTWQQESYQAFLALFVLSSGARLLSLALLRRVPSAATGVVR